MKKLLALAAFIAAGLFCAAPAYADEAPPPPSGTDSSSYGSIGTPQMGASAGKDGYSVTAMGTTVTSVGWPTSQTTVTGPGFKYDATTDYGMNQIQHWSNFTSPGADYSNNFEAYYDGTSSQETAGRIGSSTFALECHNGMCTKVNP